LQSSKQDNFASLEKRLGNEHGFLKFYFKFNIFNYWLGAVESEQNESEAEPEECEPKKLEVSDFEQDVISVTG
jgi:hypothetical protein